MRAHQLLESRWAEFNDLDPAGMVACNSGSSALVLALEAMQLPAGSACCLPDYTMVMCARAVVTAGLHPVFVGCDDRLLMDGAELHATATRRREFGRVHFNPLPPVKAVMAVHIHGRRCDVSAYASLPGEGARPTFYDNRIIEDLAEAHGVLVHPATDAACWSFYSNKIVNGEEGGAVWFRDPEHAKLARSLRSCGFTDAHDYTHNPRGANYRLADSLAEKVLGSLSGYHDRKTALGGGVIPGNATLRRIIESWYDAECPPEWRMPERQAVWCYDLRIPGLTRDRMRDVVTALQAAGIAARYGFKPMSLQREFCAPEYHGNSTSPNALRAYHEVFSLPVRPGETSRDDCRRAFEVIADVLK